MGQYFLCTSLGCVDCRFAGLTNPALSQKGSSSLLNCDAVMLDRAVQCPSNGGVIFALPIIHYHLKRLLIKKYVRTGNNRISVLNLAITTKNVFVYHKSQDNESL